MSATTLAALAFARRGHPVVPLNWPAEENGRLVCSCMGHKRGRPCNTPAKHPYGKLAPHGLLSGTVDSGTIKYWFEVAAPDANLGVVTDRLVVVDIDPRHAGDESLAVLEREHGELPHSWRALTGGGGEHVLFACPEGVEISNVVAAQMNSPPLGAGIDVRARGGYIVAPPSRHISGRPYAWSVDHHPQDVPLAPAPDWLIARLRAGATTFSTAAPAGSTPVERASSDAWTQLTGQPITEYHDMAAARIAGHLFRRSCDYQLVLGLMQAWNSAWCRPPLGYHELNRIVARIANKEAARIERELAR
jgi:hypothetical protein